MLAHRAHARLLGADVELGVAGLLGLLDGLVLRRQRVDDRQLVVLGLGAQRQPEAHDRQRGQGDREQ